MECLLATDPRGDMAGVVHPQLEPARQVALGLVELRGRDQLVAQPGELGQDRFDGRRQVRRIDAGRDLERPGVGVLDQARRDVVGEAQLLTHGQEESAAHAVAEDRVQDGQRPGVGMIAAQTGDAENDLGLRRVALAEAGPRAGRKGGCRCVARDRAVARAHGGRGHRDRPLVIEVADDGHDRVRRAVGRPPEVVDRLGRQGQDVRLLATDLATKRTVTEHRRLEEHLAVLVGVVEVRADLLDDHGPFTGDVVVVELRPDDELADDIEGAVCFAGRDAHPVDGRFAVRGRVERAAHTLDRLADRPGRRVGLGALEGEVLHEVGDTDLAGHFEPRPREHIGGHGDRACRRKPGADHARSGWQHGPFEHRRRWYRIAGRDPRRAPCRNRFGPGPRPARDRDSGLRIERPAAILRGGHAGPGPRGGRPAGARADRDCAPAGRPDAVPGRTL